MEQGKQLAKISQAAKAGKRAERARQAEQQVEEANEVSETDDLPNSDSRLTLNGVCRSGRYLRGCWITVHRWASHKADTAEAEDEPEPQQ